MARQCMLLGHLAGAASALPPSDTVQAVDISRRKRSCAPKVSF